MEFFLVVYHSQMPFCCCCFVVFEDLELVNNDKIRGLGGLGEVMDCIATQIAYISNDDTFHSFSVYAVNIQGFHGIPVL